LNDNDDDDEFNLGNTALRAR